jgi:hypothetical protein
MYNRIKSSIAALVVSLAMIGTGFAVGDAPTQPVADAADAAPLLAVVESAPRPTHRGQGLKRHLAMPFYSLAPMLPRGEP